jgi:medium-chain acyl-[acyl-carrier-protein] hydrolase
MLHNRYCSPDFSQNAAARVFCLPHAGGGTAAYYRWRSDWPKRLELVPIALAGREARIDEMPITRMNALVGEVADAIAPALDRPYALVGHSIGAWVAFELARELRARGLALPRLLVVAACGAPHTATSDEQLHNLPDAEFVAEVARRFDGIPPAVRENAELLQLLLPALRADIELLETYQYIERPPLETDIMSLGGANDPAVTVTELNVWRRHTVGKFSARMLPGGHFFLFEGERAGMSPAARVIAEQLEQRTANA